MGNIQSTHHEIESMIILAAIRLSASPFNGKYSLYIIQAPHVGSRFNKITLIKHQIYSAHKFELSAYFFQVQSELDTVYPDS